MQVKNERADIIADYIKNHKDSVLDRKEPFVIAGKRRDIVVNRLPLELLVYNIRNGRFAAELQELEVSEGRRLDPSKNKDAAKIEELLLRDTNKTEWLKKDLQHNGQLQPATITHDGYIINGNRRAAILNNLSRDTGDSRFAYLEVVRLPDDVLPQDLWRFEAGFQLAVELKVDYGPVNELLKIKEGKEYGLKEREIALILGGDNTAEDVKKKLKVLELVEDYLAYFGQDKRYSTVKRNVEHFIDLVNIMQRQDWNKLNATEQTQALHLAYHMIHDADTPHLEIRKLGQIVKDRKLLIETANEVLQISGVKVEIQSTLLSEDPAIEPMEDEINQLEAKLITPDPTPEVTEPIPESSVSPTPEFKQKKLTDDSPDETDPSDSSPKSPVTKEHKEKLKEVYDAAVEKATLKQQKKTPGPILKRVETNLQALNEVPAQHLKSYAKDFRRIEKIMKELSKKFG